VGATSIGLESRVTLAVLLCPFKLAVTVAVWFVLMVPATAVKLAWTAPVAMVTLDGTLSVVRLLVRVTDTGVRVTAVKNTEQDVLCPDLSTVGGQDRANNCADAVAATRLNVDVRVIPLALAVITAD
jgi:hypothetical protein